MNRSRREIASVEMKLEDCHCRFCAPFKSHIWTVDSRGNPLSLVNLMDGSGYKLLDPGASAPPASDI
jgi:hypothetical protein